MTKYPALIVLSILALCQCSLKNAGTNKPTLIKVGVVYKIPALYTDDSAFVAMDSSCIYYYGKYRIYETPFVKGHFLGSGEFVADSTTVTYFGYDTSKSVGYKVEYLQDNPEKRVSVDSFLKTRPVASTLNEILKQSTFTDKVNISRDAFIKRYSSNMTGLDSLYLYFDKSLGDLPFSLSKYQDSANNSKLSRIEIVLSKDSSKNAKEFNKFRKASWELIRPPIGKNAAAVIEFCSKMEVQYGKE